MRIEVQRILDTIHPTKKRDRTPSIENYRGLLNSGNIKYLDKKLQEELDDLLSRLIPQDTVRTRKSADWCLKNWQRSNGGDRETASSKSVLDGP